MLSANGTTGLPSAPFAVNVVVPVSTVDATSSAENSNVSASPLVEPPIDSGKIEPPRGDGIGVAMPRLPSAPNAASLPVDWATPPMLIDAKPVIVNSYKDAS